MSLDLSDGQDFQRHACMYVCICICICIRIYIYVYAKKIYMYSYVHQGARCDPCERDTWLYTKSSEHCLCGLLKLMGAREIFFLVAIDGIYP